MPMPTKRSAPAVFISCCLILMFHLFPRPLPADTAEIRISGEREYKAIRLTPDVYARANRDLSDILILDESGKAVPYFIHNYELRMSGELTQRYPLTPADSFTRENDTYADYFAESEAGLDIRATSLSLETDSALFAKNIELWGGYDGLHWDFIREDKLYRVEDNEKLYIVFDSPLKYSHYRFILLNNTDENFSGDALSIGGVTLEYSSSTVDQVYFTETVAPGFRTEPGESETIVSLYGLTNLRLRDLSLETDSRFKRPVSFPGGGKVLYNLSFGGNPYQDLRLDLRGVSPAGDVLELRIDDGDDDAIHIGGISLRYFADDIVFKGENGGCYTLRFGDPSVTEPPDYDIGSYKDLVLSEGYDTLRFGDILREDAPAREAPPDYSGLFNAVVIGVSLLLGVIILRRLRRSHGPGTR